MSPGRWPSRLVMALTVSVSIAVATRANAEDDEAPPQDVENAGLHVTVTKDGRQRVRLVRNEDGSFRVIEVVDLAGDEPGMPRPPSNETRRRAHSPLPTVRRWLAGRGESARDAAQRILRGEGGELRTELCRALDADGWTIADVRRWLRRRAAARCVRGRMTVRTFRNAEAARVADPRVRGHSRGSPVRGRRRAR